MLGRSRYSRDTSTNVDAIDRRLRSLEQRMGRIGGRASASAVQTADQMRDGIASALSRIADRFGDVAIGDEAAKIGNQASKLGNDALRRLSREVGNRPLVALGLAVGIGILVGLASHRRRSV